MQAPSAGGSQAGRMFALGQKERLFALGSMKGLDSL